MFLLTRQGLINLIHLRSRSTSIYSNILISHVYYLFILITLYDCKNGDPGRANVKHPKVREEEEYTCRRSTTERLTDNAMAIVLLWFSVACFCVRDSVVFHLTCVHISLVRFGLPSGHFFGNSDSLSLRYDLIVF